MFEDTIIAVSTPPGFGGLGIVRLSGPRAAAIAARIFRPKKKTGKGFPAQRLVFGNLRDPDRRELFDEAFLAYFAAPRSYTREDVVELSCHGSPAVLDEVVRLGVKSGARLAHPGEFTLRAYLNGRLDILQAEAVNDLVRACTPAMARLSFRQLSGSLSKKIAGIREGLVHLLAEVEAAIEFPDEGLGIEPAGLRRAVESLAATVRRLVASYDTGRAMSQGLTLAITGKTNVGKSTLFNALLEEDRALVTRYPGTTRDYLRERIVIGDYVFHLVDMAGLGKPSHPVERKGMMLGRTIARSADGLIIVVDASRRMTSEDGRLLESYKGKKAVLVLNKTDLPARVERADLRNISGGLPVVEVSALRGTNMDRLREEIVRNFGPLRAPDEEVVLHTRQRDILQQILDLLEVAAKLILSGHPEEIWAEDIRRCLPLIGRLTGEVRADEIIEDIFGRFCVGK